MMHVPDMQQTCSKQGSGLVGSKNWFTETFIQWPTVQREPRKYCRMCQTCNRFVGSRAVALLEVKSSYQPGACSVPGWSYRYFAIFEFVCLSVCPSVQSPAHVQYIITKVTVGLGTSQWCGSRLV